jgi:hypothetical protein
MRRLMSLASFVAVVTATAPFAACHDAGEPDAASAFTNEPFFIRGEITDTGHPWGYRVKGEPGTNYRVTDVVFGLTDNTLIRRADGSTASSADLVVGTKITLWIEGAIAESLPPQVGARLIVLR